MKRSLLALLVLALLVVACGPTPAETVQTGDEVANTLPPEASVAQATVAEATASVDIPTETPAPPAPGDVFFQDDFSDTASGWAETSTSTGTTGYFDGGYRVFMIEPQSLISSTVGGSPYANVSVEADIQIIGGVHTGGGGEGFVYGGEYGLICRYQDENNFYGAGITTDSGFYGFFEVADGELLYFGMPGFFSDGTLEEKLNPGDTSNHFRLDCVGDYLELYVNDQLVEEAFADPEYSVINLIASGDVGFYVSSWYNTPETDILFDNFVVSQPVCPDFMGGSC